MTATDTDYTEYYAMAADLEAEAAHANWLGAQDDDDTAEILRQTLAADTDAVCF